MRVCPVQPYPYILDYDGGGGRHSSWILLLLPVFLDQVGLDFLTLPDTLRDAVCLLLVIPLARRTLI